MTTMRKHTHAIVSYIIRLLFRRNGEKRNVSIKFFLMDHRHEREKESEWQLRTMDKSPAAHPCDFYGK